ncbi:Uncharacterised protein [Escherichia coli]|uniref:Uncharacterized protein n=1 Tax=Escherichia coli TaxID=562 RepID=A0A377FAN1_ECOLX|nr:Uncharacterised protein [Escherichia coli]
MKDFFASCQKAFNSSSWLSFVNQCECLGSTCSPVSFQPSSATGDGFRRSAQAFRKSLITGCEAHGCGSSGGGSGFLNCNLARAAISSGVGTTSGSG